MKKKALFFYRILKKGIVFFLLNVLLYACVSQQSERGGKAAKEATSVQSAAETKEEALRESDAPNLDASPAAFQDPKKDAPNQDFGQGQAAPLDFEATQIIERIERKKRQKIITAGEGTRLWQAKVWLPEFKVGTFAIDSTRKNAPSVWVRFVDEGNLIEGKLHTGEVVVESLQAKQAKGKFKGEIEAFSEIYVVAGRFQTQK
jgi:hypothetical protein